MSRRRAPLGDVAAFVTQRRGELGMTQTELAAASSVDVKTIYNLESGEKWPQAATRARVERALGLSPGTLHEIREGGDVPAPAPQKVAPSPGLLFALSGSRVRWESVEEVFGELERLAGQFDVSVGDVLVATGLVSADDLRTSPARIGRLSRPPATVSRPEEIVTLDDALAWVVATSPGLSRGQIKDLEKQLRRLKQAAPEDQE
uniref:helix-turn-helix domain-containing protein n=1 Tax=Herbidospora sakaeratensis TaxID=564415 RepID=UPI000785BE92|nr:helix-turn-helix transcriptional regulator [Herbidospora sakaeratensis]